MDHSDKDRSLPVIEPKQTQVKVWDLPVRLFHWTLVVLVINAFVTAKFGDVLLKWHQLNGQAILTLVLWRILWGLVGSETARFANFVKGPGRVIHYLQKQASGGHKCHESGRRSCLGHNPAGAMMIIVLLALLLAQGSFGLFADDEILVRGPLALKVSESLRGVLTGLHVRGFWVIAGFALLHVAAVAVYKVVLKENLVAPMVTGQKQVPEGTRAPTMKSPWLALGCLGVSAGTVWSVVNLLP